MKSIIVFLMISGLSFAQEPVCSPPCSGSQFCVEVSGANRCLVNCTQGCGPDEICFADEFFGLCFKDCLDRSVECNDCVNGYEVFGICTCTGNYSGSNCNVTGGSLCPASCLYGESACAGGGCYFKFLTTPVPTTTGMTTTEPTTEPPALVIDCDP